MTKLPNKKILCSILRDAILDRESFDYSELAETTAAQIASYSALLDRLERGSRLKNADKDIMALSCFHARLWRESYIDSVNGCLSKEDMKREEKSVLDIGKVEKAIGMRYTDGVPSDCDSVNIFSDTFNKNKQFLGKL